MIDVIILTYTKNLHFYGLTSRTINSLRANNNRQFNIVVVESNKNPDGYFYPDCTVITPQEEFNYNKFLNIGLQLCKNKYVLICNNDLFFTANSVVNLIDCMEVHGMHSACPLEPNWHETRLNDEEKSQLFLQGYEVEKYVLGWCICVRRDVFNVIGQFDEKFKFWYQDNDYAMNLQKHNIPHYLINTSIVRHEFSQSHGLLDDRKVEMTHGLQQVFFEKWQA